MSDELARLVRAAQSEHRLPSVSAAVVVRGGGATAAGGGCHQQ